MVFGAKDATFRRFCQHFPHTFLCRFAAGLPSVSAPLRHFSTGCQ
ncbi:hypothetical protein ROTMU0001_0008 [Rothia mucilaginosa ATCC 25296]|nr:hypothetical protein ROTMU0001_0008 [Rothia mucilaginosa ATCC 25296]